MKNPLLKIFRILFVIFSIIGIIGIIIMLFQLDIFGVIFYALWFSINFAFIVTLTKRIQNPQPIKILDNLKNNWLMWLLLIIFPPIGIIYMLVAKKNFSLSSKILLTVIFALWFALWISTPASSPNVQPSTIDTSEIETETPVETDTTLPETITVTEESESLTTENEFSESETEEQNIQTQSEESETLPESNTSKMVDYIASQAKESATAVTDEKLDEALTFIYENYPDYYKDNETMEKAMYYGYYLEYAYSQTDSQSYADLGTDVYQAVKYVYRNQETTDETHTQENLRQINEKLIELGYLDLPSSEVTTQEESSSSPEVTAESSEEKVWLSETGEKYHRIPDCGKMNPENAYSVTRSEAESTGHTACSKCF